MVRTQPIIVSGLCLCGLDGSVSDLPTSSATRREETETTTMIEGAAESSKWFVRVFVSCEWVRLDLSRKELGLWVGPNN